MWTRFWRWFIGADKREAALAARQAHSDAIAAHRAESSRRRQEALAAEVARMRCPKCVPPRPIDSYSDENDYICDVHGFVHPVRDDGAIIDGNGDRGPLRVIGHV